MRNNQLESFINEYVNAVDARDIHKVNPLLESNFRVVMTSNHLKNAVTVIKKDDYLKLMEEGKVGGLKREVTIHSIHSFDPNCTIMLTLENEKIKMESVYGVIEMANSFKLVSDLLHVTFKQ